jgi:predicted ATPase/DNA-binding winged helix-turn-helix (wHTH) protein
MLAEGARLIFVSGECEIDLARRELRILGSPVPIGGRAFEVIEVLARSAGELVTKDELMNRIWPGAIVTENTLQVHAAAVRKALGPYRTLLKTEAGRGYRLLGKWTRRHDEARSPDTPQQVRMTEETPATNLPANVMRLVGRSSAILRLQDLVSAHRVVTLTGPGGIGKTTLALEVSRRIRNEFEDGAWLVELASLSDADLVASAVAEILGLKLESRTVSPEAVARAIGRKKLLLILDNCEHVIDAAAALTEMVVRLCPHATVLATSREVLRIAGEHTYRVPSLEVPADDRADADRILGHSAPELFIARAKELGADFLSHTESLPTIAAICRQLDGIPLAIEFAAAQAATLGVAQVAAALRDRFVLLTSGRRTALPRHRTLRATFDWSYQLLPAGEQLLLRWLSVFPSGFSLAAAMEILASRQTASPVVDGISGLVSKSLLNVDETAAVVTYRMLETTREYAYKKLAETGEAHAAAQRHALYVRNAILRTGPESAIGGVETENSISGGSLRTEEIHNVRAALDWCFSLGGDVEIGLEITAAYARTWLHMSLMTECRARMEAALARLKQTMALTSDQIMQLYVALSIAVVHTTGLVEDTQASLEKALKIAASSAEDITRLRALWAIWDYHSNSREYGRALHAARKFYQMATRSEDKSAIVVANRLSGHSLHYHGEHATARLHLEQVLKLATKHDRARTVWFFQYDQRVLAGATLARVLWLLGYPDKAAATAEASSEEAAELGHRLSQCYAHATAEFPLACLVGNLADAAQALDACIKVASDNHLSFYQSWSQCMRGVLLVEQDEFSAGVEVLSGALPVLGRVASRQPEFQIALAKGLAGTGKSTRALDVIGATLEHAKSNGEYWCIPELLRIRCQILITPDRNGSDAVEQQLRDALRLARKQGARSWELRAAVDLAALWVAQGQRDRARALLLPIFETFDEGLDTADLKAAQRLLATLR